MCLSETSIVVLYVHNELVRHELLVCHLMQVSQPYHYWHLGPYLLEGDRSVHCGMFSSSLTSIYNLLIPVSASFPSYDKQKYPQISLGEKKSTPIEIHWSNVLKKCKSPEAMKSLLQGSRVWIKNRKLLSPMLF